MLTLIRICLRLLILAAHCFLVVPQSAGAQEARAIYQRSAPSVVALIMLDRFGQPISLGSGFVVAKGFVATNFHVIRGSSSGQAKVVGSNVTLTIEGVVAKDPDRDLAILKVSTLNAAPLPFSTSKSAQVGEIVYSIGNPQGMEGTLSQGIVSGIRIVGDSSWIQITAAISPGSSGGPVLDDTGGVIGVAVATLRGGQSLNFAVAARHLNELLAKASSAESIAIAGAAKITSKEAGAAAIAAPAIQKVTVSDVQCTRDYGVGDFECNFSVRNTLDVPIKNIRYLAILRDARGNPVDAREGSIARYAVVRPGLAIRTSNIDGRFKLEEEAKRLIAKIEVRILGFESPRE